jgi:hypothetical protein
MSEILATDVTGPCAASAVEARRLGVQNARRREAFCASLKPCRRVLGELLDLSSEGAALLLCQRFEPGNEVFVEVIVAPRTVPISLPARVIRSTLQADATWVVAFEFMGQANSDQLRALLH